jgi:serine/threonine protein phosphatase PrpC
MGLKSTDDNDEQCGLEYLDPLEKFCAATTAGRRGDGYKDAFSRNQDRYSYNNNLDTYQYLSEDNLKNIFHDVFYKINEKVKIALSQLSSDSGKVPLDSGSTALVSYKQGNRIFIANAGDCRATLVYKKNNKYHIKHLTQDIEHRSSLVKEQERIKQCGGNIVHGRLERGGLANTRGLGAPNYIASGFSCAPDFICVNDMDLTNSFLLNSTDGFWEHIKDHEIEDVFNNSAQLSLKDKAKALRRIAYENNSQDNITVALLEEGLSGVFDGFGDCGEIAAQTAAENFKIEINQNQIVESLKLYANIPAVNNLKKKLSSAIDPSGQSIKLAKETKHMLDVVDGTAEISEKIQTINQYYLKNIEPSECYFKYSDSTFCPEQAPLLSETFYKECENLIIAIAIIALCAIIGALLGAFCGGVLGGLMGAAEGAAIGFGAATFTTGVYWGYKKSSGSLDAAYAPVSAVKYQDTFSFA